MFDKRINIFAGHFGSGKTEVSLNFAVKLAEAGYKTAIIDFDIVNPYFRAADTKEKLKNGNIRIVAPIYANTNADVPALPSEVYSIFREKRQKVVLDIGGDDLGAKVLSRFRDEIMQDDFEMFFVINVRRFMTDTMEKIEKMLCEIETSSRLKVTKLVNNTNLLQYTSEQDIIDGHRTIEAVSRKLGIPIGFISCMGDICRTLKGIDILNMRKQIKLPWEH